MRRRDKRAGTAVRIWVLTGSETAAYGHFGQREFAWEHADAADELLAKAKKYDGHSAGKIRKLKGSFGPS